MGKNVHEFAEDPTFDFKCPRNRALKHIKALKRKSHKPP